MKEDQLDKEIMDYLDGVSNKPVNEEVSEQGEELKQILSELKGIPHEKVSPATDAKFYTFLEEKNTYSKPIIKFKAWWPYLTAAASIIILFFMFTNSINGFEYDYRKLLSNPDRLGFIYELNKQQLSSEDISWLKSELKNEINPNIKVTIVDLLANYQSKLDNEFYNSLQSESIPSVQMALLNSLESSEHIDFVNELLVFNQRKDLDKTVRQKVKNILSNQ
jgi:hypothetical protein